MSWIIGSSGGVTSALTGRARSTRTLSMLLGKYAQPTTPVILKRDFGVNALDRYVQDLKNFVCACPYEV